MNRPKLTFAVTREDNLPLDFNYLSDPRNEPDDRDEDEAIDDFDDSIVDRSFIQNRDMGDENFFPSEEI